MMVEGSDDLARSCSRVGRALHRAGKMVEQRATQIMEEAPVDLLAARLGDSGVADREGWGRRGRLPERGHPGQRIAACAYGEGRS